MGNHDGNVCSDYGRANLFVRYPGRLLDKWFPGHGNTCNDHVRASIGGEMHGLNIATVMAGYPLFALEIADFR